MVPSAHAAQVAGEVAPAAVLKVPALQLVHDPALPALHVPGLQKRRSPLKQKEPAGQGAGVATRITAFPESDMYSSPEKPMARPKGPFIENAGPTPFERPYALLDTSVLTNPAGVTKRIALVVESATNKLLDPSTAIAFIL